MLSNHSQVCLPYKLWENRQPAHSMVYNVFSHSRVAKKSPVFTRGFAPDRASKLLSHGAVSQSGHTHNFGQSHKFAGSFVERPALRRDIIPLRRRWHVDLFRKVRFSLILRNLCFLIKIINRIILLKKMRTFLSTTKCIFY